MVALDYFCFCRWKVTSDIMVRMCRCQQRHFYSCVVWAQLQFCGWSFTDWKSVSTLFVIVFCRGRMHIFFNILFLMICCGCSSVHCPHPGNFWNASDNQSQPLYSMWASTSQSLTRCELDNQGTITGRGTYFCIHYHIVTDSGLKSSLVHILQIACKYPPSE